MKIDEARWIINKITSLVSLKVHEDIEGDISYEKIGEGTCKKQNMFLIN